MMCGVHDVDVVDDTFVVAAPEAVARAVADPAAWRTWWPDLSLTVTRDRGVKGQQWAVSGALSGTAEVWVEPWGDGAVVHWYLRVDLPAGASRRQVERERRHRQVAWKGSVHRLKDDLEGGRPPGEARVTAPPVKASDPGADHEG